MSSAAIVLRVRLVDVVSVHDMLSTHTIQSHGQSGQLPRLALAKVGLASVAYENGQVGFAAAQHSESREQFGRTRVAYHHAFSRRALSICFTGLAILARYDGVALQHWP